MKDQKQQIKDAKRAYIIAMTSPTYLGFQRFCVYLDEGTGLELEVLWPSRQDIANKALLRHQVQCNSKTLPIFHFTLSGCGYCKTAEIAEMLREINRDLSVAVIGHGYSPSLR